ncbi:hypothetical protein [Flavihumibacter sp. UBA7668]|uniref:hypothetical protein n=1 Tax=Flavihumibacter sp. UBA7668 TaxID=1946542 RepID=UPI0025C591BF|nr:hypothetical protein [Flavihumibacter sp. UBA7668]
MKHSGFLFLCLLLSGLAGAQVKVLGVQAIFATDREGRGMISNAKEIEGSPFATEEWKPGNIIFSNGLKSQEGALNFDLYSNKPAFRDGQNQMHFKDPVKQITYTVDLNGQPTTYLFRNEYPAIGSQDRSFYYRVMEDGANFHLLQLLEKTVSQEMINIGTYKNKFVQKEDWYLYDVKAAKLVKFPKSKKDLNGLAAELSPAFGNYLKEAKSVNPKNPDELIRMVQQLNQ